MTKHFDRPIPKPTRDIFLANGEYYFYDEDCFGHNIQKYEWPITSAQILAASDNENTRIILDMLDKLPKHKSAGIDSYQLKHFFERYLKDELKIPAYFTNDEGKLLMLAAGFTPTNKGKLNWKWNTSLPALNYHFLGIEKVREQKPRPIYIKTRPRTK